MALKPLRNMPYDEISLYMNETAERGCVVIYDNTVSGLGDMDDAGSVCKVPTNSGGNPIGILMNDVVNLDQSRYALNMHQDEVQLGGKVRIGKRGFVRTNAIAAGVNPVPGSGAYFTTSGNLTMFTDTLVNPIVTISGVDYRIRSGIANALIGRFSSARDADGYVKVEVNLS